MTRSEAKVGVRVFTLHRFVGVPKGTEGVIDEDYGTGVMVAWDLPVGRLPAGYSAYDGVPMIKSGILRDGFAHNEFNMLEVLKLAAPKGGAP